MSDMTGEACACLTVQFKPRENEDGSRTERWLCSDCGREFRPMKPEVTISAVAARIVAEQAAARGDIETLLRLMRAYGVTRYRRGDLEIELAPAAAVERIWREVPSAPVNDGQHALEAANVLWSFLDDIDTADDRCKEDDAAFRRAAMALAKRREELAQSRDGHTLTWHWERDAAAEQFGRAVREVGYLKRVPASGPEPGDAPPTPEPPDEQPAVEIDFAATEELLRAQDARRRGIG